MSTTYSILNHLGHEVGTIAVTDGNPLYAYAIKVNAPLQRLIDAGYTTVPPFGSVTAVSDRYEPAFKAIVAFQNELALLMVVHPADSPERARLHRARDSMIDAHEALMLNIPIEELPS